MTHYKILTAFVPEKIVQIAVSGAQYGYLAYLLAPDQRAFLLWYLLNTDHGEYYQIPVMDYSWDIHYLAVNLLNNEMYAYFGKKSNTALWDYILNEMKGGRIPHNEEMVALLEHEKTRYVE